MDGGVATNRGRERAHAHSSGIPVSAGVREGARASEYSECARMRARMQDAG